MLTIDGCHGSKTTQRHETGKNTIKEKKRKIKITRLEKELQDGYLGIPCLPHNL